ncbi:hypothetical protein CAP31_00110 [Sulfuriferula sp. AH1]|uniref:DUF3024 domain-containing protein n=1 Tax=Sulfuriferula sp. AH1 TaxID=1985873 RepID=UPI000B3B9A38|nr:DUF3024 domain-containing protein [Sulfuriferula sp. AH1]ARU30238.1 hypothetical protein CAP31_00110 [Sulfuriferula sp. AH1]
MSNRQVARHTKTKKVSRANYHVSDAANPHPNEFDLRRITRMLALRVRYRYVEPEVQAVAGGYRIVSPCCSRNIDVSGGTIDIARLEYAHPEGLWRLYHKDHGQDVWKMYALSPLLHMLISQLNEDPLRVFWQ